MHDESCTSFTFGFLSGSLNGLEGNLVWESQFKYCSSHFQCHSMLHVKSLSGVVFSLTGLGIFSLKAKVLPYDSPAQYVFDLRVIDRLDASILIVSLLCEPRTRLFIV